MKTRLYIFLSMILLLQVQTGCIYENAPLVSCDSEEKELLVINLDLTVPSSSVGTRSTDDKLSQSESYIDIANGDYKICIFDKDDKYVDNKLSEIECKENGIRDGVVSYTLTAKLSLSGSGDKERLSQFKMMVLTNWKSFEKSNTHSAFEYPSFADYSLSGEGSYNIFKNNDKFNFTLKEQNDNSSWIPSESKAIPMFGITDKLDLQAVMDMSEYGDGPCFSVSMLRAMAKVQVIDEIGDKIGSVSMSDINKVGRFIPEIDESTNTGWSVGVNTPSLPEDPGNISKIEFVPGPTTGGKSSWVAYIPEMDLTKKRPVINIQEGANSNILPSPFNYYKDGKVVTDSDENLESVLRNHSYNFHVYISDRASVSIKLDVLPWDMEYDDNPWYYDSPKVESGLEWFSDAAETDIVIINQDKVDAGEEKPKYSYNGFVHDTGNLLLIMKEGTEEYVEASFRLSAPKNCTWHAELVFLEGRPDAFYFVDARGEEMNGYPAGTIDGTTPATIRIKNRHEQVETNPNEMRLVFFVEYPDNIAREVKVVDPVEISDAEGNKKTVDNYTIVQNRTDIY